MSLAYVLRDFDLEAQRRIALSFCSKVLILDECWAWRVGTDDGYARLSVRFEGRKVKLRAHRVSFELFNRPLGRDEVVLHMCDNRTCTSPLHLEAGTRADNVHDALAKGRHHVLVPGLDPATIEAILFHAKAMLADGATPYEASVKVGAQFGVSRTTVARVVKGKYRSR